MRAVEDVRADVDDGRVRRVEHERRVGRLACRRRPERAEAERRRGRAAVLIPPQDAFCEHW